MRRVTAGHAGKAMGLTGLGCVNQQRSLVPRLFRNKPPSRLITPGVTALYSLLAATAAERVRLAPTFAHLDRTSVHVDGRDNSDAAPDAHVVHITRGYRRDHRPDLNQVLLALSVEHQAGLPLLMKPLNGNSREAQAFGEGIRQHMQP